MARWIGRPATEIADAVRSGMATAVEVTREHVEHSRRVDPDVGAYDPPTWDAALTSAEAVDRRADRASLPLAGVPIAIKDVVDIAGMPTLRGTHAATLAEPAAADAPVIDALRQAGAVLTGKTRCPELCFAASTDNATGAARNPWDLGRIAGGSSGGSAAAVASAQVPLALGSDGSGSIRMPSTACGLVGLKPTNGSVVGTSKDPADNWYGLSTLGPIGTTVQDVRTMFSVIAGQPDLAMPGGERRGLRISVSEKGFLPLPVSRAARSLWLEAIEMLRADGHQLSRASPSVPLWVRNAMSQRSFIGALEDAERMQIDESRAGRRTRDVIEWGRKARDKGKVPVEEDAARWRDLMDEFFAERDLLLTPATGIPPFRQRRFHDLPLVRGGLPYVRFSLFMGIWNLAGLPAIVLPIGRTDRGLPLAIQLVAGRDQEGLLLDVAASIERQRPWPRHPQRWVPSLAA